LRRSFAPPKIDFSDISFLFIHSIFWISAFALLSENLFQWQDATGFYFLSVLAAGHSVAPMFLMSKDSPKIRRSVGTAALVISVICAALLIHAFYYAVSNPSSISVGFLILGLLYFSFNTWHFSSQNYGILSLLRGGRKSELRFADRLYSAVLGLICIPLLWLPEGRHLKVLFEQMPSIHEALPWGSISVGLATGAFILHLSLMARHRFLNKSRVLYSLGMLLQVWAISRIGFLPSLIVYFVPHWLAEIYLVTRAYPGTEKTKEDTKSKFLLPAFGIVLGANYMLAREFPIVRQWFNEGAVSNSTLVGQSQAVILSCAAFFAIVFLHYYMDRAIYRRGSPFINRLLRLHAGALPRK
jgi:hypothetical protein